MTQGVDKQTASHAVVLAVVRRSKRVCWDDDRIGEGRELGVAENGWNWSKLPWEVVRYDEVVNRKYTARLKLQAILTFILKPMPKRRGMTTCGKAVAL